MHCNFIYNREKTGKKSNVSNFLNGYKYHRLDGHEFKQAPGVGDGQGSLACYRPWGRKELDTTERLDWTETPLDADPFREESRRGSQGAQVYVLSESRPGASLISPSSGLCILVHVISSTCDFDCLHQWWHNHAMKYYAVIKSDSTDLNLLTWKEAQNTWLKQAGHKQ